MFTRGTVTVVTAGTGHPKLRRCVESVKRQTFGAAEHWVVVDGREREAAVRAALAGVGSGSRAVQVVVLPHATGKDKWNGHRIYAAAAFLHGSEFIAYLDEDNWLEPDHLETLVAAVASRHASWGFALRRICDQEGHYVCDDDCESLGSLHAVFSNERDRLVDTSCYLLARQVAAEFSFCWYRAARVPGQLSADRLLCQTLMARGLPVATSGRHTVNYAVGNRPDSVTAEFFLRGNRIMAARYPAGLPWKAPPVTTAGSTSRNSSAVTHP